MGGQQVFSPYAAMGNSPGMMIDPNGEMFEKATQRDPNELSGEDFTDVMESSLASGASKNGKVGFLRLLGMNSGGGGGRMAQSLGRGVVSLFSSMVSLFDHSENQGSNSYAQNSIDPIGTIVESTEPNDDVKNKDYYGDPFFVMKYYNGNPDKPVGRMSLSQANKWYHIGKGEGVYIDFTTIVLPDWVTADRFKNPDYYDGNVPVIYIRFDHPSGFVNPNQALVYGGIRIALVGENTVWAYPDVYDFDQGEQNGGFGRDAATLAGGGVAGFGYTNKPQAFEIYFIGYQKIPKK